MVRGAGTAEVAKISCEHYSMGVKTLNGKQHGTVHRTIEMLATALSQLDIVMEPARIEKIAVMVHRGMSQQQRSFHNPEHIFDLADPEDPHTTLAALFHDLVYHQVDQGFHPEIEAILQPYLMVEPGGVVSIAQQIPADARGFHGCAAVFGFQPGQQLSPFGGLNEFLSALVMALLFEGIIADVDMLVTVACIEATIPFRGEDAEGRSPAQQLYQRLIRTSRQFSLNVDENDVTWAVTRAITFANRDVRNFSEEEVGRFLENTWKLLPETNPELRVAGVYSIRSYRLAVQKMRLFLKNLPPSRVFQTFQGVPPEKEYIALVQRTDRNLIAACQYLGVKFLTAVILEALADLSGGDAPIALFMGEIAPAGTQQEALQQICDFLPEDGSAPDTPPDEGVVHGLLENGRSGAAGFDLQNAPLSLYVYRNVGAEQLPEVLELADALTREKPELSPREFLSQLPESVAAPIARAAAQMVVTRRDALEALASELEATRG